MIVSSFVWTKHRNVMDRQAERQTARIAIVVKVPGRTNRNSNSSMCSSYKPDGAFHSQWEVYAELNKDVFR